MTPQHDRDSPVVRKSRTTDVPDELRQEILMQGYVTKGFVNWSGKIDDMEASIGDVVEIPIDDLMRLIDTHVAAIERQARIKAQLGMVKYYAQVGSNEAVDWMGLLEDNRKQLEYELAQLRTTQEADNGN